MTDITKMYYVRSLLSTVICHMSLIWQQENSPSPHNLTCSEPVLLFGVEHQSKSEVRKHLHFLQVTRQIPGRQRQTCSILCIPTTVNCFGAHKDEGYDYSLLFPNISSCFWKYRVDSSKYSCWQWLILLSDCAIATVLNNTVNIKVHGLSYQHKPINKNW